MPLLRKFRHFMALSIRNKSYFLKSLFGLMVVTVFRRFSSPSAISQYLFHGKRKAWRAASKEQLGQQAYLIHAASAILPFGINCLDRALWMHRSNRSYDNLDIRLGARKSTSGDLEAHAWIECEGDIILGRTDGIPYQSLQAI